MAEIKGSLPSQDQQIVDEACATLDRVRQVSVRSRAGWMRLDDLPPEDVASLKAHLHDALADWAAEHEVSSPKIETGVEVRKSVTFLDGGRVG